MISNRDQIIANGANKVLRGFRTDAMDILEDILNAVDPREAVLRALKIENGVLIAGSSMIPLNEIKKIIVVGGGKAGAAMVSAVESVLNDRVSGGAVNIPHGSEAESGRVKLNGASHPIPDDDGVKGVTHMMELVSGLSENDLVISVISGGGSALMPCPAEGVGLGDLQQVTQGLLLAGATINEINAVRKHLSNFKGGHLARACHPAQVVSLILSDVIGDPLDAIASGPTAPDSTTFQDAVSVLKKFGQWDGLPEGVRNRLEAGVRGDVEETPKLDDSLFERVTNIVVANNGVACEAAMNKAEELGYFPLVLTTYMEGEAREVGTLIGGIAKEVALNGRPVEPPAALILGGETTVTVKGTGRGGRNLELALSAALRIEGVDCLVTSFASDGADGSSGTAGAVVDGNTIKRSKKKKLDPDVYMSENDSGAFFEVLGDNIITGLTGTNVNDVVIILVP